MITLAPQDKLLFPPEELTGVELFELRVLLLDLEELLDHEALFAQDKSSI